MSTTLNRDNLVSFANSHRDEYESLVRRFVETPTVSVDPNHLEDIRKGVELTVETIEAISVSSDCCKYPCSSAYFSKSLGSAPDLSTSVSKDLALVELSLSVCSSL